MKAALGVCYQGTLGKMGRRIMGARPGAGSLINRASKGIRKGFSLLAARVRALWRAVRVDNIRLAQRLRVGLGLYLKHLEEPLRNDVRRLFEVSGLWVRNIGDRHKIKREIDRLAHDIVPHLGRGRNIRHVIDDGSGR